MDNWRWLKPRESLFLHGLKSRGFQASRTFLVTLPPLLVAKMNAVAAKRGVKRNDLFIEIFQKYLDDEEHQEKLLLQPARRAGCNG
jgi:hypothetical protein